MPDRPFIYIPPVLPTVTSAWELAIGILRDSQNYACAAQAHDNCTSTIEQAQFRHERVNWYTFAQVTIFC